MNNNKDAQTVKQNAVLESQSYVDISDVICQTESSAATVRIIGTCPLFPSDSDSEEEITSSSYKDGDLILGTQVIGSIRSDRFGQLRNERLRTATYERRKSVESNLLNSQSEEYLPVNQQVSHYTTLNCVGTNKTEETVLELAKYADDEPIMPNQILGPYAMENKTKYLSKDAVDSIVVEDPATSEEFDQSDNEENKVITNLCTSRSGKSLNTYRTVFIDSFEGSGENASKYASLDNTKQIIDIGHSKVVGVTKFNHVDDTSIVSNETLEYNFSHANNAEDTMQNSFSHITTLDEKTSNIVRDNLYANDERVDYILYGTNTTEQIKNVANCDAYVKDNSENDAVIRTPSIVSSINYDVEEQNSQDIKALQKKCDNNARATLPNNNISAPVADHTNIGINETYLDTGSVNDDFNESDRLQVSTGSKTVSSIETNEIAASTKKSNSPTHSSFSNKVYEDSIHKYGHGSKIIAKDAVGDINASITILKVFEDAKMGQILAPDEIVSSADSPKVDVISVQQQEQNENLNSLNNSPVNENSQLPDCNDIGITQVAHRSSRNSRDEKMHNLQNKCETVDELPYNRKQSVEYDAPFSSEIETSQMNDLEEKDSNSTTHSTSVTSMKSENVEGRVYRANSSPKRRFNPFDRDVIFDDEHFSDEHDIVNHLQEESKSSSGSSFTNLSLGEIDNDVSYTELGLAEDYFSRPEGHFGMTGIEELEMAIENCKELIHETQAHSEKHRNLVKKLIQLRLKVQELKEGEVPEEYNIRSVVGHRFRLRSSRSSKHYCEKCNSLIWGMLQFWYKCTECGYCCHEKCLNLITRTCASVKVKEKGTYILNLCPERGLAAQGYRCAECRLAITYLSKGREPRMCDYSGSFYCDLCHWNDTMVIPARVTNNWDFEPRKVCRASKQFLRLMYMKPVLRINDINAMLFNYVEELHTVKKYREEFLVMKKYFLCCKKALDEKLLLQLKNRQHFVENSEVYSLQDLVDINNETLIPELNQIHATFTRHITQECQLCRVKGFICEICKSSEILFPFDNISVVCPKCSYVLHRNCFIQHDNRCPRCDRRDKRGET